MANADLDILVAAITGTGKKLEDAEIIYGNLKDAVRKMRIVLWVGLIGLILDLGLSIAFTFILHDQSALNDQVESNQVSIHKAECDLNTVLIAANTPEQRERSPNPNLYDSWYDSIYKTRIELGCRPLLTNPHVR